MVRVHPGALRMRIDGGASGSLGVRRVVDFTPSECARPECALNCHRQVTGRVRSSRRVVVELTDDHSLLRVGAPVQRTDQVRADVRPFARADEGALPQAAPSCLVLLATAKLGKTGCVIRVRRRETFACCLRARICAVCELDLMHAKGVSALLTTARAKALCALASVHRTDVNAHFSGGCLGVSHTTPPATNRLGHLWGQELFVRCRTRKDGGSALLASQIGPVQRARTCQSRSALREGILMTSTADLTDTFHGMAESYGGPRRLGHPSCRLVRLDSVLTAYGLCPWASARSRFVVAARFPAAGEFHCLQSQ